MLGADALQQCVVGLSEGPLRDVDADAPACRSDRGVVKRAMSNSAWVARLAASGGQALHRVLGPAQRRVPRRAVRRMDFCDRSNSIALRHRHATQPMQIWIAALALRLVVAPGARAQLASPHAIEVPLWFALSFLDFRDDVADAHRDGKRLLVYFGQDVCPYCRKLMETNFSRSKRSKAIFPAISKVGRRTNEFALPMARSGRSPTAAADSIPSTIRR
jgi:hypothetical protein